MPNLSSEMEPLHHLLRKGQDWNWGSEQEAAFRQAKGLLTKAPLLVHFDATLPIKLHCDASSYGLGGVLSHVVEGMEKPVAYTSRKLNSAERNYSMIEKEGLVIVYAIRKFHQYLWPRGGLVL